MGETLFPAQFTVHTPSGPTDACEIHASALVNLMSFMGAHANTTPAVPGAECANCANEAAKS